jgi:hypothetical protein
LFYLKKNQGFKLGLHERDFEAGKYIADNIIDVINRSKKIIFVISSSFTLVVISSVIFSSNK